MAINKIFTKKRLLNSKFFSGIFFTNSIIAHRTSAGTQENIYIPKVVYYRSASCGCCKKWINHLRDNVLEVVDNIFEDVSLIRNQFQIPNNLRSCLFAQIDNYRIEERVSIKSIKKLFGEKTSIKGIALEDKSLSCTGIEIHFYDSHSHYYENYKVVKFRKTGKTKIFDKISS